MNPSPLRYPGGKYKLYTYIKELVQVNNCTTYIEPFCGGAAVAIELLLNGVVKNIIINDYDYSIYCFWEAVINQTDAFVELIQNTEVSIDEWHRQKAIRDDIEHHSELEVGFSTFFLNRTNRSGIIDKAGPIGGLGQGGRYLIDCRFNRNHLVSRIREIEKHKKKIQLYNLEALDFVGDVILRTRKSFAFFDPPYYGKGPELYANSYTHGDHANLANTILEQMRNRKWIVTYDNVSAIRKMYASVSCCKYRLQYTLQDKRTSSELMFYSKKTLRPHNENQLIVVLEDEV